MAGRFWFQRAVRGVVLAAVVFVGGCATRPRVTVSLDTIPAAQREQAEQNLRVFYAVWDDVNRKHYEPQTHGVDWEAAAAKYGPLAAAAPDESALYRTINDMLGLLHDSHTHALTPAQANAHRLRRRERTGISLSRVGEEWIVADVLPGSPAAQAGIEPGWVVLSHDGLPLGERPELWFSLGQPVRWEFLDRENEHRVVTVKATTLPMARPPELRELEPGVLYLRFDEFYPDVRHWVREAVKQSSGADAMIVDLRYNAGGQERQLERILGCFFDRPVDCGTVVTRNGARTLTHVVPDRSAQFRGKLVLLVEASTASSAEIFSAVMKDQRRALIVGRKTAGAVLVSDFLHLPDGGQLQLSEEDYIAPNGRRIESNGIEPDIVVTRTMAELRAGHDPDLEAALKALHAGAVPKP